MGGAPPERHDGSATLTQAAKEAAKDSTEKHKRLDVGDEAQPTYGGTDVEVGATSESLAPSESAGGGDGARQPRILGVVAGGGSLGGQEFEGFGFGGLDFGFFGSDRLQIDFTGLVISPNLSATSVAGEGLKDELELALDLSARYYLTPPHTFLGFYPLVGMRFGTLFWSYRSPLNVIADGGPKTIEDDQLNYFGAYGGLGVSLAQTRNFTTGINFTAGYREYDDNTYEGFHNTVFPATGFTQMAIEMAIKF